MTAADRLGFAKYLFNLGKEYGDLFRGSLTGGAALTFVAKYLGLGTFGAVLIGACMVPVAIALSVATGWVIWRWRITHATIEREWENNPFQRAQIDVLREIRDALRNLRVQHALIHEFGRRVMTSDEARIHQEAGR